jgi:hypothetical protein
MQQHECRPESRCALSPCASRCLKHADCVQVVPAAVLETHESHALPALCMLVTDWLAAAASYQPVDSFDLFLRHVYIPRGSKFSEAERRQSASQA